MRTKRIQFSSCWENMVEELSIPKQAIFGIDSYTAVIGKQWLKKILVWKAKDDERVEKEYRDYEYVQNCLNNGWCAPELGLHAYSEYTCPGCGQVYCWGCSSDSQLAGPDHEKGLISWATCPKCGLVEKEYTDQIRSDHLFG